MQEKYIISVTNDEFELIDKVILWHTTFFAENKSHDKILFTVVKQLTNRIDAYAGLGYVELTSSQKHYSISACEWAQVYENYDGLDELIEKLKNAN